MEECDRRENASIAVNRIDPNPLCQRTPRSTVSPCSSKPLSVALTRVSAGESSNGPPKKRHRRHKDESRKRRKEEKHKLHIVDDDLDDDAMWVEKNVDLDGERVNKSTGTIYARR
jgi:hypothetical protein